MPCVAPSPSDIVCEPHDIRTIPYNYRELNFTRRTFPFAPLAAACSDWKLHRNEQIKSGRDRVRHSKSSQATHLIYIRRTHSSLHSLYTSRSNLTRRALFFFNLKESHEHKQEEDRIVRGCCAHNVTWLRWNSLFDECHMRSDTQTHMHARTHATCQNRSRRCAKYWK